MKEYLKQHSIVYRQPAKFPEDGAAVGNRFLTGMVWSDKGKYSAVLAKDDVWDNRTVSFETARCGYTHEKVLEMLKNKDKDFENETYFNHTVSKSNVMEYPYEGTPVHAWAPYPAPKIAAWFSLDTSDYRFKEQRLSLADATVTTEYEGLTVTSVIPMGKNVFVTDIASAEKTALKAVLERRADPVFKDTKPEFALIDGIATFNYVFPEGFSYAMAIKADNAVYEIDGAQANVSLEVNKKGRVTVSVATSNEAKDPISAAIKTLDDVDVYVKENESKWENFWEKSHISLTDKYLENVWYASLYQAAISSSPNYSGGFYGPFWIHDPSAWCNDLHEVNEPFKYYGVQAANHPELADGFIQTYYNMIPYVKDTTRKFYGFDALRFPHACGYKGEEREAWATEFKYQYMQCASGLIAQIALDQYRFTKDKDDLKNRIYPIVSGAADFYAQYMEKGEDGKYHIYPSFSPEQWKTIYGRDMAIDLAFARMTLRGAVETAQALGVDEDKRAVWSERLENIAPYPEDDKGMIEFEKDDRSYMFGHDSVMYCVHPTAEYSCDKKYAEALEMTLKRMGIKDIAAFSKAHIAVDALWLGMPELGYDLIYDTAVCPHMKPNGFGSIGDVYTGEDHVTNLKYYPEDFKWEKGDVFNIREVFSVVNPSAKDSIELDITEGGMLLFVNEMLLQSQLGDIRVFPALPAHQNAAFDGLLARGGVEVSSKRENGEILFVKLCARADTTARLCNPWACKTVYVNGKELSDSPEILSFDLKRGQDIMISADKDAKLPEWGYEGDAQPRCVKRTLVQALAKGYRNDPVTEGLAKNAETAEIWLGKPAEN